MSSESREQILADFTECTGLENVGECIDILEQYQWNLLNAVHAVHERIGGGNDIVNESAVPKHSTTASSQRTTNPKQSSLVKKPINSKSNAKRHSDSDDNDDSDEPHIIKTLPSGTRTVKGASGIATRGTVRELRFIVEHKDNTERITMSDNESVQNLRAKIAERLHVAPNRQNFINWSMKSYDDRTILKDLGLPKENTIHLTATASSTPNGAARSSTTTTTVASNRTHRHPTSPSKHTVTTANAQFQLTVICEDKSGKSIPYELLLQPTATISELKEQIEQAAHIPIRQQSWTGLLGAKDSDELRQTLINRKANLVVRKSETSSNQQTPISRRDVKHQTLIRHGSEDEPMDVDPDIDLEQFVDDDIVPQIISNATTASCIPSSRELLIPDRCTDDVMGLEHFTRVFHARYGSTGPILYIGSLDQAIQDSLYAPVKERRPLAIYLHNDRSVCANVFCAQVLASETLVEYLANNYVVWAWDVTSDANRTRLLETMKRCLGHQYAQRIAGMEKDAFPLLLIVVRSRGAFELISVIEGKSTPNEVFLNLVQAHDLFDQQRERDFEEENVRAKREDLKKQQEAEYERSRLADLAKEKVRIDDERRQQEEQDATERLKQKRLKEQRDCQARLPAEPSETEKHTTRFKIRLPDDEGILMRRFRVHDNLQILFDFLSSQGRMFGEYKLLSMHPKRDLTTLNKSDTFEQLKLYPQEQLILESL